MPRAQYKKRRRREKTIVGPMLTTGEACRILYVHSNTLRRWSSQGLIKAYRIGPRGDRRFKLEDVASLLFEIAKDGRHKYINQLSASTSPLD